MVDLYRVTSPDDPVLENGNKLCKGKPVAYLLAWKSEKVGNETDPRFWHRSPGRSSPPARPTIAGATTMMPERSPHPDSDGIERASQFPAVPTLDEMVRKGGTNVRTVYSR
jgi:hypothetical protein